MHDMSLKNIKQEIAYITKLIKKQQQNKTQHESQDLETKKKLDKKQQYS